MAKKAFDKIMAGLKDAVAYAVGDRSRGVVHKIEGNQSGDAGAEKVVERQNSSFKKTKRKSDMRRILLCFVFILICSASYAADDSYPSGWKEVYRDAVSVVYYNPGRIEIFGQKRTFYTKTEWTNTSLIFVKGEYFISKLEVNCNRKTIRLLERQYFDVDGVPGTKEDIHNLALLPASEFREKKIDDSTIFWFNLVCKKHKKP